MADPPARNEERVQALSTMLALSLDAFVLTDGNGKILDASGTAGELLGVAPERLEGRLLVSFAAPHRRKAFRANLARAAAGATITFRQELAPRGEPPMPVLVRVGPAGGGLAWVLRDETLHERDVESRVHGGSPARIERLMLGRALESLSDGVVVVSRELDVEFANRRARVLFAGAELDGGRPLPDLWTVSVRELVETLLEQDALNAEALVEPDERTAYWIRAFRSGDGALLLISDVSAEERRERTEREFIANAAHELQSPLAALSNAVEVLLSGAHEDPEARPRFLGHIARETERLSRLLRSLLLLAQAEAAAARVHPERVQVRGLLERVVGSGRNLGATVELVCPGDLYAAGHEELLEHALLNLVSNAVRHGRTSRVVVVARRRADGRVVVELNDDGPGMTEQERRHVFDRFYRGGARTSDGFGLGLSIALNAARAVGGDVELRPRPGGGTTARLILDAA